MDDILNEMGNVWKTLGNDQQAALAQSVAGVRQYSQLMALMENWDYFKDNLEVAKEATGTLQEQADIYAESWEAAQKRVQASAQAIYQDLVSDEFFIDLQNNFADFLDIIDRAIDGMGGLKGVVALFGGVLLTAFSGQAARGLENMAYNIKMMTTWGSQEIMQTKELAYQEAMRVSNSGYITETQEAQVKVMQTQLLLQNDLVKRASNISEEEKQRCQAIINENKLYGEQLIELTKIKEQISDSKSQQIQSLRVQATQQKGAPLTKEQNQSFGEAQGIIQLGYSTQQTINSINQSFDPKRINDYKVSVQDLITQITGLKNSSVNVQSLESSLKFLQDSLDTLATSGTTKQFQQLIHEMSMDGVASTNSIAGAMQHLHEVLKLPEKDFQELAQLMLQFAEAENKAQNANNNFKTSVENSRLAIANAKAAMSTWADSLVRIAGGVSSLAFAMQSLSSIGDVFSNKDMTAGEKFLQITMSLSMAIPMLVNGLKALRLAKLKDLATTTLSTIVKVANAAATNAQAKAEARKAAATNASRKETDKQTVSETANAIAKKVNKTSPGGTGKPGIFNNIKNSWNQQALENNPNFTKMKNGAYQVKTTTGTGSTFMKADDAAQLAGKQSAAQLGRMAGGVALIAAAIAVVAGTITWASAQWNKAANEAKKAAEEASKLSNEFSNAQNQYSELKDTISNYQEGVKGLQELTKGTTEYTEAMIAANEEASKLIDQYGLTNYTIEDGLIKISEAELNAAKAAQLSQVSAKQRAATDANIRAKETENESNRVKFNRETGSNITAMDAANAGVATGAGAGAGALAGIGIALLAGFKGAAAGSAGGPIGAIIGAAVGLTAGIVAGVATGNEQKKEQEAIEGLAKLYENDKNIFNTDESLRQALKEDLNIQDEDLIEELVKNRESTKELISSIDENNKLIQAQRATAMTSYLQGDKIYQNSEYQDQITNILSKENENSAYTKALKEAEDVAWKGSDKRIHEAYAEYMGYEFVKDTHSGTGKFKDAQGNEVEIDDETMVEFLTNEYARQEAAKNVEEVSALLDSLTNISGLNDDDTATAQSAIADFIAGDSDKLLALSDEQMDAVKEQLKNGISLTDEEAQMLGYDNAKAFTEAFDKQLENWSSMSAEQRAEKMAAIKQQEFDSAIASTAQSLGVSSEALEGYTKALQNANPELQDNSEAAIAAAKANINFSKGVAKLDETLKDNYDILQDWNEESFETYEAAGKVQAAVKEMFGVDVSADFVKDNLQELQELTEGNTEHLDELREAAAKDFVVNLGLEEGATNALDSALDALINQDREGVKIGAEVDLGSSVDQLNQFLKDGTLTAEQVTQAFNAIGYEPEIGYITDKGGQTTHQTHEVKIGGEKGLTLAKVDTYTTSDVSVPYIKSSTNTDSKGNRNKSSGTKITSTGSIAANLAGSKTIQDKQDKSADRLKDLEDEKDRYHEINEIIEDTERALDKLSEAKDRAFGQDKLALMQQEIDKQKELIKNNETLLAEAEQYLQQDKQSLIANTTRGLTIEFDEEGRIANYEALQNSYIQRLRANVGNETAYENINKDYENFKDAAERYEETLDKVKDQQQAVIDKQNELADLALEKIEYTIQIEVDAADDDLARLDFLMQTIEDDAFSAAEAIEYMGEKVVATQKKMEATKKGIEEVMAEVESQGFMTKAQAEFLRSSRDEIIDYNAELLELSTTVHDKLTEAYDAWNEKLQENADIVDHYGSMIEHYKNIVDIVGKDNLGISDETMAMMRQAQVENANDALRISKATMDANKETLEQMKAARERATDPDDIAKWDEQIKHAEETLRESTEEFMGDWETALQAAADAFGEDVQQIAENFSEAVSGIYKNLEELQEAFDRQKEVNDRYLEGYEKTYEISKLNRQIAQSIDKTDNIGSQKELRDLQKQLLAMNEAGVEVSQKDIEYMQKKYDLMIAEQAFKDAQNAKSVVRLQRDSKGNFGYVYTADQNNVDSAQANYEEKLYQMQKFGEESLLEIQEQIIATNQEFANALLAIQENANLSLEEKEAKAAEVTEYYTGKLRYWSDEANKFMEHGQEINASYNTSMAENFNETLLGQMQPDLQSFEEYYILSTGAMTIAGNEFTLAIEGYQERYSTAMQNAGTSVEDFEKTVKEKLPEIQKESKQTADDTEQMSKDMIIEIDKVIDEVEKFQKDYSSKFATIRSENLTLINSVNDLIATYQNLTIAANEAAAAKERESQAGTGSSTGTNGNNGNIPLSDDIPKSAEPKTTKTISANVMKTSFGQTANVNGKTYFLASDGLWYNVTGKKANTSQGGTISYEIDKGTRAESRHYAAKDGSVFTIYPDGSYRDKKSAKQREVKEIDGEEYVKSFESNYWYKFNDLGREYNGQLKEYRYWIKKGQIGYLLNDAGNKMYAFNTGGYTGAWGPEGRLAMLHQKELVLNAHDTENFLTAIGIVRDISDQIEKNALVMQYQNQLTNYRTTVGNGDGTLQQEVHITAEFPNATNHSEIEEAFRNLTNLASQYANRKN